MSRAVDGRKGQTKRVHALGRRVARPVDWITGPAGGAGVLRSYPKSTNILGREGAGG